MLWFYFPTYLVIHWVLNQPVYIDQKQRFQQVNPQRMDYLYTTTSQTQSQSPELEEKFVKIMKWAVKGDSMYSWSRSETPQ